MILTRGKQTIDNTHTHTHFTSNILQETTEKGPNPYQWLHFSRHLVLKCFEFNTSFISNFHRVFGYHRTVLSHILIWLQVFDDTRILTGYLLSFLLLRHSFKGGREEEKEMKINFNTATRYWFQLSSLFQLFTRVLPKFCFW